MNKITEREKEIIKILKNDPMISQEDLAQVVGISRSAVAVHISNLIGKGFILGRGYVFNDKTGVLILAPVFIEVEARTESDDGAALVDIRPGGAYLTAHYLAAQDIPTQLMSILGRDDWGGIIAERLKKQGVDTRYLIIQKDYPTPRRVKIIDSQNNWQRSVADQRAVAILNRDSIQNMGVAVSNCRMLVVDGGIPAETVRHAVHLAREAGVPVCFRFPDESDASIYNEELNGLSVAIMVGPLAAGLTKSKIKDLDDGIKAGKILNAMGIEVAVIVIPDQGVVLTGDSETVTVPLMPVQGKIQELSIDVLTGGLVSGILHGYDYRQAVRLGLGMAVQWAGKSRNLSKRQE
ncbi:MAG: hypothetical protein CVV03_07425 [Firmicutes bacterium HGW-Firmicutes-8]|nr:MAG: hypothetical protein CVV03_07425 [Firmicutes bacterium HGW-Firmicutes-8]